MRIGMLLMGGTYPPDIRVEKEARVLVAAGHEVFLLTSDKDGGPAAEKVGPLEVRRYQARAGAIASKLSAVATLATWRSPLWERAMSRFVTQNGIEALHVHDLPAVASALRVGRRRGLPVVYDMHENYPAAVGFWPRTSAAIRFQTPDRYRAYERAAVRGADRVVTVVDEARQRVLGMGARPRRVVVFGNVDDTREVVEWQGTPVGFTVAYAGGFGPHRGLETLVRAIALMRERVPLLRLLLMGAGTGEAELKALVSELGLAECVDFTGWLSTDEVRARLALSSVGVVPHERSEHTDTTVPHKLFQYMAMGLPVMVTDCAPLARIVADTGAGEVAVAGDAASMAEALVRLADPSRARAASAAGKRAVAERYNLEAEGASLVALYDGLAASSA